MRNSKDAEYTAFLDKTPRSEPTTAAWSSEEYGQQPLSWRRKTFSKTYLVTLLIHTTLILANTTFLVMFWGRIGRESSLNLHPLPGLNIKYRTGLYADFEESVFAGPPSPELDGAWHDFLANMAIRVSDEELAISNQSSVKLPVGGGNMAWLGVFHELHCIKMLRQWNYREHYHPGLTEDDRPHWDIHADHCFELLRSAAVCRADTTLTTFGWATQEQPMLNTRLIPRRCTDWDALMNSVAARAIDKDEIAALVNPLLHRETV